MTIITKTFTFATGQEGFVGTAGASNTTLSWDATTGNPAGALKARKAGRNSAKTTSYWEWSGTWEALGVTAGSTVTSVRLVSASTRCTEYATGASSTIGPYELRDFGGTVLGTLWAGRTITGVDAAWVATAAQTPIAISGAPQSSNSVINIRLSDQLATGNNASAAVSTYDDQVSIEVTFTEPPVSISSSDSGAVSITDSSAKQAYLPSTPATIVSTSSGSSTASKDVQFLNAKAGDKFVAVLFQVDYATGGISSNISGGCLLDLPAITFTATAGTPRVLVYSGTITSDSSGFSNPTITVNTSNGLYWNYVAYVYRSTNTAKPAAFNNAITAGSGALGTGIVEDPATTILYSLADKSGSDGTQRAYLTSHGQVTEDNYDVSTGLSSYYAHYTNLVPDASNSYGLTAPTNLTGYSVIVKVPGNLPVAAQDVTPISAIDSGSLSVIDNSSLQAVGPIPVSSGDSGSISVSETSGTVASNPSQAVTTPRVLLSPTVETTADASGTRSTGTITVSADSLVIVTVSTTGGASATGALTASAISSTIPGMGPWSLIQQSAPGATAQTATYVFYAANSSGGTGDITVTLAATPADSTFGAFEVTRASSITPVTGAVGAANSGLSTLDLVLSDTPSNPDRVVMVATSRNSNGNTVIPSTGLTSLWAAGHANPNATQYVAHGNITTTSVGYSGLNTVHNSGVAFIVKAGSPSAPNTPVSASDSGSISVAETSSVVVTSSNIPSGDTGSVSVLESSSVFGTVASSDSGAVSVTESSSMFKVISASDSGSTSISETALTFSNRLGTEGGTLSVTETSAVAVSGTVAITAFDSGGMSVLDLSNAAPTISSSDSGSIFVTESNTSLGTIASSDAGSVSITESNAFFKQISASDLGAIAAADISDLSVSFKVIETNDSGNVSVSETSFIAVTFTSSDSGAVSVNESHTDFKQISASDSGSMSVSDSSSAFKSIQTGDSGNVSLSETSIVFNDRPGNDAGSVSVTETSSVVIAGTVTKSAFDSGSVSVSESRGLSASSTRSDIGNASVTETTFISGTMSRQDSGFVSISEQSFVFKPVSSSESGALSLDETANILAKSGTQVNVWNGISWVSGSLRIWNGVAWIDAVVRRWDGTSWV